MTLAETILHYMHTGEGDFNQLAMAVFNYQYQHCLPYQHYCRQLNCTPQQLQHWQQVPAVSTDVFREFDLCTFDPQVATYVFQTSGTTQEAKGKHYYREMRLYDAAIRGNFMNGLGLTMDSKVTFRMLTPSFAEVATSSLFYMLQQAMSWYGDERSKFYYHHNEVDYDALFADLQQDIELNRPIVLIGTAFSWVNLFDHSHHSWQLPRGSSLMETGGLKGRARSVSREQLYELFKSRLGLDRQRCYSEYGMTELSSQCYSQPDSHIFLAPEWMATQIINPETGQQVAIGETGLVQFFDLANLESISAVTTSDMAIRHVDGFELIGRAPLAILRGCSTAFEVLK